MANSKPIKGQIREMKPMSPEERKEQATRAYLQKRESIATGVLFNLMHNPCLFEGDHCYTTTEDLSPDAIADFAIKVSDALIEKLYFVKEEE